MRQGIIPSISQIAGLELTDRVYAVAGDDDDPAGLTGVAQGQPARADGQTTSNGASQ